MQRVSVSVSRCFSCLFQKQASGLSRIHRVQPFFRPFMTSGTSLTNRNMAYTTVERGCLNTPSFRVFITDEHHNPISPFHDIPLYADEANKICNMVVEIPRWTNHKMEICKEEEMNPIKQDIKKGAVRFVKNCFPHHGYIWNYGALPQTWEDVAHVEPTTGTKGDNDPLDVCEIGQTVHPRGSIIQVKILGVMCLIDEGETDWKVICIDVTDPLAEKLNDIDDVEIVMPGLIKATNEWFRVYKIPDGKPANEFAYNGEARNRDLALKVIDETNQQWQKLVGSGDAIRGDVCCSNVCVAGSPYHVEANTTKDLLGKEKSAPAGPAVALPDDVDKWHYISASSLASSL